ncbi:MAG: tetratricopeptide repeat protein, partial [Abditibacteriaceae bacterium]
MKALSSQFNNSEPPKSTQEWAARAHSSAQNSRWPECEEACLEVLERQSDNLEITELMATACLQTGHLDAAEHLLQTLLRRVPLDPWYRMRYATLLQTQGKFGAAQRELLRLQLIKLPEAFAR